MDKHALKEHTKTLDGELGGEPRSAHMYDELSDCAAKDVSSTVPISSFRASDMMRHGAHLLPFAGSVMLNLDAGAHKAISPEQRA